VEVAETLTEELKQEAQRLGYAKLGVARVGPMEAESTRLRAWLAAGHHGTMSWMEDTEDVRCDPSDPRLLEGARSVLVMVAPYGGHAQWEGPEPGRVARYARGRDYHNVLGKRGRKLTRWLRERGFAARASVDSMPVFERAWAERSGVGFIGKNSCLIVPGLGSHVFLSCLITTAELAPDSPIRAGCGDCTACLDACPTSAFVGARQLDSRRCISYLTIEAREPSPVAIRGQMGDWLYGCDVCQDVCPYNQGAGARSAHDPAFAPGARWEGRDTVKLLQMDEEEFREFAAGSPLRRAGRQGLARNAAIVLGNTGDRRYLPVLQHAAQHDESESVRAVSTWAVSRLDSLSKEPT